MSPDNEKRQILVADDDPAILRLVSAILEKENYGVTTARDGREAYKILQGSANFIAAIFDVVMPHIAIHEDRKTINERPGDDDDRRTGSKTLVRQFLSRGSSFYAQAIHHGATTYNVADGGWQKLKLVLCRL